MPGPALPPAIGWAVLASFSVIWVALGWFWGRRRSSFDDHVLAGRNVGVALGTATAMATWVTSNTTMAAPQLAYQLGIWGMVGYSLGAVGLILFAPLAERIKALMPGGYTSGGLRSGAVRARELAPVPAHLLVLRRGLAREHGDGGRASARGTHGHSLSRRHGGHRHRLRRVYAVGRPARRHRNRLHPERAHPGRPRRRRHRLADELHARRSPRTLERRAAAALEPAHARVDHVLVQQSPLRAGRGLPLERMVVARLRLPRGDGGFAPISSRA